MNKPIISVVMPVYNGERYLKESIDSIINQSFVDFEFIIVNDGSKDLTKEIIESYCDSRIRLFNIDNIGLAAALNFGISKSQTDLIARMDADDICDVLRLEKQYLFMKKHKEFVLIGTGAREIDMFGTFICEQSVISDWKNIKEFFPKSPFVHPSVMFRKKAFFDAGMYPEFLSRGEDTVLFNRMSRFGKMGNLKDSLLSYRITDSSLSDRNKKNQKFINGLVLKTINCIPLTNEDNDLHSHIIKQKGTKDRKFLYHIYISKKYLFNNFDRKHALSHLFSAMRLQFFSLELATLLILSLMPSIVVKFLYSKVKNE
jgi:glycosyltransferase involved in cell wall biosynthesis